MESNSLLCALYSSRDNVVLDSILEHVEARWAVPNKTEFDFINILISGDAGTGKSRLQDGMRYVAPLRPYFLGATNVAGRVLRKIFMQNHMFVPNFKVHNTTFQPYRLTPDTWAEHLADLYDGLPADISSGTSRTPEEFWGGISNNLKRVCAQIFKNGTEKKNMITPEEYASYRHYTKSKHHRRGQLTARELHELTMDHIAAAVPSTRIPDQLMYNSAVVDEVGRIEVSWMIVEVGMWYHIHRMYSTGVTKPVYISVGSCTQSSVINSSCFLGCGGDEACVHPKIPINNYSSITALTRDCIIFMDDFYIKENKHNRRMVPSSASDKHAVLSVLRHCLEMNYPVPSWVYTRIRQNMTISEEEFYRLTGVMHLCPTHAECREVMNRDKVDPNDIIPREERMLSSGGSEWPYKLYNCTGAAGVMFKSANYISHEWPRKNLDPTKDLSFGAKLAFGITKINSETGEIIDEVVEGPYSAWTATRVFHRNRPYITSNTVSCIFRGVSGGCTDFLADLEEQEHMFIENVDVYIEILACLSSIVQERFPDNASIYQRLLKRSSVLTCLDEVVSAVNDLKSILKTLIKTQDESATGLGDDDTDDDDIDIDFDSCTWKRSKKKERLKKDPEPVKERPQMIIHYVCDKARNKKAPRLTVPKGEPLVLLGESGKVGLRFRLGKTMELLMFPTTAKVYQAPDKYPASLKGGFGSSRKRKTYAAAFGNPSKTPRRLVEEVVDDCDLDEEELAGVKEELRRLNKGEAVAAQTMREEISGETRVGRTRFFTVLEMFPVKLNLQRTVASSQGMTYGAMVFGKINNVIDANTFIVICTRSVSPEYLKFLFPAHGGDPVVIPLDRNIVDTNKKMHLLSDQKMSGYI